ncbi:MAG: hypothetical protein OXI43_20370 [Candidatus Poribacteria bacterium]|nr:hypothetical protein [Candidatus Poribacteria bacterium]
MYKNLASFIGAQNVFTLKHKTLSVLTIFIFAACFITGCENRTSTKLLEALSDPLLELNRTVTVTLTEKDGSGITGTAIFMEYVDSDTEQVGSTTIRNFDVEIQNAVPGRKYAAYIYSGSSCDAPGSIWDVESFNAYSFTADENGMGERSYLTDLTIDTNPATDILGKVLVIHEQVGAGDLADGTQVSCGVITLTE